VFSSVARVAHVARIFPMQVYIRGNVPDDRACYSLSSRDNLRVVRHMRHRTSLDALKIGMKRVARCPKTTAPQRATTAPQRGSLRGVVIDAFQRNPLVITDPRLFASL
jgi:hypothetical protein